MRKQLLAVWRDPVWSKLIAGAITAAGVAASTWAGPRLRQFSPVVAVAAAMGTLLALTGMALIIALFRRSKTLIFVSSGGTCRDPMAKAIAERLVAGLTPRPRIRIRAAGLGPINKTEASYAARYAIREMYDEDLLKDHRPKLLTAELVDEADLILVMDHSLLGKPGKTLPSDKTYVLKEFLGLEGDVDDPYPDGRDPETLRRYRETAEELRMLLTAHFDKIMNALAV